MKNLISVIALLVAGLCTLSAQNLPQNTACVTNPPNFSKLSYEKANNLVSDELEKKICPEYITNLVCQLRSGHLDDNKKVLAIYLLGGFGAADIDSIEILIQNIDLKAQKLDPKTRFPRWGEYPAVDALVKIGRPVLGPIFSYLPNEKKELCRHLMCVVLVQVEGKKGYVFNEADGKKIAKNQIKKMLADESDSARQANLGLALKELGE